MQRFAELFAVEKKQKKALKYQPFYGSHHPQKDLGSIGP